MATVAVLGGSFGGLTAAYEIRKHLVEAGLDRKHEVVLISDRPSFTFRPALPWVLGGARRPEQVIFDLSQACRKRGIGFIHAHVLEVDANRKCVAMGSGNLFYDQAVVALGVTPVYSQTPGLQEHSYSPLWLEEAQRTRSAIKAFRGGAAVLGTASSGPWPCPIYEVLSFLLDRLEADGNRSRARLTFVTSEPAFMFYAGPAKADLMGRLAAARGVNILANARIKRVTEGEVLLTSGVRVPTQLTMILPHMGPQEAVLASKGVRKDRFGFLEVNREMRVLRHDERDGLWAVGDCVSFEGLKNGRNAEIQARVAAWNIARKLRAVRGRPHRYISEYLCVSRFGRGRALVVWTRPGPQQGYPKRIKASAVGRWPYFAKIGFEKAWLARHN